MSASCSRRSAPSGDARGACPRASRPPDAFVRGSARVLRTSAIAVGVIAALVSALAVAITPASATYRGGNGRIAFAEHGPGGVDIYSVLASGRGKFKLTSHRARDSAPAYSPDGRRVAFHSDRGARGVSEIWTVNADGSRERRITRLNGDAMFPDYSPDGSRIAFSGHARGRAKMDVYVINANGRRLVRLTKGTGNDERPVWSPGGRKIAFVSDRSGVAQVYVMRADGTRQRRLTTVRKTHYGVDWSPDGRRLVYDEGNPGEATSIWMMNADGSGKRQLTPTTGVIRDFGPAWSPDGKQIVFTRVFGTSREARQSIFVMDANGKRQHALTPGGKQVMPAWQPRSPRR